MDYIDFSEVKKMLRSRESYFYLMHISWFTPEKGMDVNYEVDFPDAIYILCYSGERGELRWRDRKAHAGVIKDIPDFLQNFSAEQVANYIRNSNNDKKEQTEANVLQEIYKPIIKSMNRKEL